VDPPRPSDFEADLLPSGLPRLGVGSLMVPPPGGGGNQVGPDHPIFDREFGEYDDDHRSFGGGGVDVGGFGLPGMGGMMGMRPRRVLRKANLLFVPFCVFPRPCFTLEASSFLQDLSSIPHRRRTTDGLYFFQVRSVRSARRADGAVWGGTRPLSRPGWSPRERRQDGTGWARGEVSSRWVGHSQSGPHARKIGG